MLLRPSRIAPARRRLATCGLSVLGDVVLERRYAVGRGVTGLVGVHLDRDGHAVQRAQRRAGRGSRSAASAACRASSAETSTRALSRGVDRLDARRRLLSDLALSWRRSARRSRRRSGSPTMPERSAASRRAGGLDRHLSSSWRVVNGAGPGTSPDARGQVGRTRRDRRVTSLRASMQRPASSSTSSRKPRPTELHADRQAAAVGHRDPQPRESPGGRATSSATAPR